MPRLYSWMVGSVTPKRIDAAADGVDRLLYRTLLDRLHLGLLHGEGPAIVWRGAHGVLAPVARIKQVAHITDTVGRRALNLDQLRMLGIGLQHRARGETALLQIGLHPADRIIRFRAHCFIHHYLQHQVDAALEVETEVDAVGQGRLPGSRAQFPSECRRCQRRKREELQR